MMTSNLQALPGMADVASCSMPSCSAGGNSGGESPPPVAVEKAIETLIEFGTTFDPTSFSLTQYLDAVGSKLGGKAPEAMIKAWDIVLEYAVPDGTTDAQIKAAIATAMDIAEALLTILPKGRRLTTLRRLAVDKQVSISASDATLAKQYKDNSVLAATTDSLTSTLGGAVTVKTQPVAKVRVETKVTSTKSQSELEAELKSPTVAAAVGGSISSVESSTGMEENSNGSVKSSAVVATSIVLLVAGFV